MSRIKPVERSDDRILVSDMHEFERGERGRPDLGTVHESGRDIPVYRQCDVLVVGGGPSGAAAAIAANRGIAPRAVDIAELQSALLGQGVYLCARDTQQVGNAGPIPTASAV